MFVLVSGRFRSPLAGLCPLYDVNTQTCKHIDGFQENMIRAELMEATSPQSIFTIALLCLHEMCGTCPARQHHVHDVLLHADKLMEEAIPTVAYTQDATKALNCLSIFGTSNHDGISSSSVLITKRRRICEDFKNAVVHNDVVDSRSANPSAMLRSLHVCGESSSRKWEHMSSLQFCGAGKEAFTQDNIRSVTICLGG